MIRSDKFWHNMTGFIALRIAGKVDSKGDTPPQLSKDNTRAKPIKTFFDAKGSMSVCAVYTWSRRSVWACQNQHAGLRLLHPKTLMHIVDQDSVNRKCNFIQPSEKMMSLNRFELQDGLSSHRVQYRIWKALEPKTAQSVRHTIAVVSNLYCQTDPTWHKTQVSIEPDGASTSSSRFSSYRRCQRPRADCLFC